jgi:hypothetical protein
MKNRAVTLKNPRTGEVWNCPDYTKRRTVDGVEFVEVFKPGVNRPLWISLAALVKTKEEVGNV